MIKETKKTQNKLLLFLGVLSLLIIFFIVASGTLKGRYTFFFKRGSNSIVLGLSDKISIPKSAEKAEKILEGIVSSSKSELSKKVIEAEGNLKTTLEKEVSELTSAQIKAIKMKVCQDWGVLNATPTVTE